MSHVWMPAGASGETEAIVSALGWQGVVTRPMRLLDRRVQVVFELDPVEFSRRESVGLGAFMDRRALETLMELPVGQEWPKYEARVRLDDNALRVLTACGGFERTARGFRRVLEPIGKVVGVLSTERLWRAQVEALSQFAAYCQGAIVVGEPARDAVAAACREARVLGIGVVDQAGQAKVVVPPASGKFRWNSWHWLLAETAYSYLRKQLGYDPKLDVLPRDFAAGRSF